MEIFKNGCWKSFFQIYDPENVVCMDNAPYHTKIEDPTPTKYATKQTMVNWLMKKKICCNPKMRKVGLFNLMECNHPKIIIYKIDNIINENGHRVVRLPPYHCDLNTVEYVWLSVKRLIRERNVIGDLSLENLKNLTQKALDEVTSQEWQAHCNHVEKLENSYWDKDELLEEIVDELIIQTGSSVSDSEETESCDSDSDDFSDVIPLKKSSTKASFFFIY
ncbi:uncharacterized protein LOC118200213 [Stegodyphus dumicola]|uniref:uncharacterized protein LOC118200213 n=1 Tax=Stegodyphus dumicola TaxID=202533 RepID=UPI0015B00ACD|nr:uncharacterized protein LOC118200213 [Stegodyphus dumicola]